MSFFVDIEKNFQGFSLHVKLEGNSPSTGILGASGSGKSMTLKCIAGIVTPDKGKIIVNDKVLFDSENKINLKPQERKIGYLFQNYALFPTMTVKDNIACGYRGDKKEKEERVADFIRRYHLEGMEKRYPSQLSGGQQQRVALARMMIGEPEMILLDEPFSALDGYLKDILQKDMQNFLSTYPGDMILVTHSRDEAYRFCRRLVLLNDGKNLISGLTAEIFDNPQLLEAARLTGCKNYSAIERLDDHTVYALDWGVQLHTSQLVEAEHTHIGIRGHWIQASEEKGINTIKVRLEDRIETTFEHQFLIQNAEMEGGESIWWMIPRRNFSESMDDKLPKYIRLPEDSLMLLKEENS